MAVRCPAWQWPEELEERGPPEDPSILLTGTARIGTVPMLIIAVRINETLRWSPDFRPGVAEESYDAVRLHEVLETMLEDVQSVATDLGELMGEGRLGVVQLATGPYRIWVMPAATAGGG